MIYREPWNGEEAIEVQLQVVKLHCLACGNFKVDRQYAAGDCRAH